MSCSHDDLVGWRLTRLSVPVYRETTGRDDWTVWEYLNRHPHNFAYLARPFEDEGELRGLMWTPNRGMPRRPKVKIKPHNYSKAVSHRYIWGWALISRRFAMARKLRASNPQKPTVLPLATLLSLHWVDDATS